VEITLLADNWRTDLSGFLKLVTGILSDPGAMMIEIKEK